MSDPYPTFDRCPRCRSMLWARGEAVWCETCEYSAVQGNLFGSDEQTNTDQ